MHTARILLPKCYAQSKSFTVLPATCASREDQVSDILMHSTMLHGVTLLEGYVMPIKTRTEQSFG